MKTAIIFGEFINKSSTGIAYMNSNLENCLIESGYKVKKISEPRSKDYFEAKDLFQKNINFKLFMKLFLEISLLKKNDISFITLSMSYLGLLKTTLISILLKLKSRETFLYIHRGDLKNHYNQSFIKKLLILFILNKTNKIIFLSKILNENIFNNNFKQKILVIPNALNKEDSKLSYELYKNRMQKNKISAELNIVYCGNIQKEKGVFNMIKSFRNINESMENNIKLNLDLYGIPFEKLENNNKNIHYKGKLDLNNRLRIMSKYDLLIIASYTEGLPLVLIECLAIGIPFITSKVGAIPDLLIDDYPYICSQEVESIENNLRNFIYDFKNRKEFINSLISKNNKLFQDNFIYSKYLNNIRRVLK